MHTLCPNALNNQNCSRPPLPLPLLHKKERLAKGHIFSHRAVIFQGRVPRHWQHLAVRGVWCVGLLTKPPFSTTLWEKFVSVCQGRTKQPRERKGEKWSRHPAPLAPFVTKIESWGRAYRLQTLGQQSADKKQHT